MSTATKQYKCPGCGAFLTFSSKSQKLQCGHCGIEIEPEAMEAYDATADIKEEEPVWDIKSVSKGWSQAEEAALQQYTCPSCGAEVIAGDTTTASVCTYCGSPIILSDRFTARRRPDCVIPFQIDKKTAREKLLQFYKRKPLLPGSFRRSNQTQEIKGIYVPFWLFSGDAYGNFSFDASNTRFYRQGDYDVTETDHYLLIRQGNAHFSNIPVDGSSKLEDSYMDAIEPFDYSGLCSFSTDYLPGFSAEAYDEDASVCAPRASVRMKNTIADELRRTCPYESVTPRSSQLSAQQTQVKYALFPVWMMTTRYKNKVYHFAVNGQSGRMVGDLPVSGSRFLALLAGITIPLGLLLKLFVFH